MDRLLGFVKARVSEEKLASSMKVYKSKVNAKIKQLIDLSGIYT